MGHLELVASARRLADGWGARVTVAMIGPCSGAALAAVAGHGADRIYSFEHAALGRQNPELLASAVIPLLAECRPSRVFIEANVTGQDLAARLAARLQAPLVSRCLRVASLPDGSVELERALHGGRWSERVTVSRGAMVVATVLAQSGGVRGGGKGREASVVRIQELPGDAEPRVRVVDEYRVTSQNVPLAAAEVIVAGGGGVGTRQGWQAIETLADLLGGAVGASRVAVDEGWIGRERMVGETGISVTPEVYVAVGISGSPHHVAGMKESRTVIAVNKDHRAPIFRVADLGIVGDLNEVLARIIERVHESST